MERLAVLELLERKGVKTFTREQWGSKQLDEYVKRRETHAMPNGPAKYHFLHITVTNDTDSVREGKDGAQQIESYGLSTPPMVSYQDLITNEGKYFQGQDYGNKGTHTINDLNVSGFAYDLNLHGYALAIMQNVNDDVTDEQVLLAAMVFAAREVTGWVVKNAPVYPHRKFANKACPGDKAVARLSQIVDLKNHFVKNGLPEWLADPDLSKIKKDTSSGPVKQPEPPKQPESEAMVTKVDKARNLLEIALRNAKLKSHTTRVREIQAALSKLRNTN